MLGHCIDHWAAAWGPDAWQLVLVSLLCLASKSYTDGFETVGMPSPPPPLHHHHHRHRLLLYLLLISPPLTVTFTPLCHVRR